MASRRDLGPISPLVTERLLGGGRGKGAAVGDEATARGDPAVLEGASRSKVQWTLLTPVPATGSMEKGPGARRERRWFSRRGAEALRGGLGCASGGASTVPNSAPHRTTKAAG